MGLAFRAPGRNDAPVTRSMECHSLDLRVPGPTVSDYVTLFYWFRLDVLALEDVDRADHAQIRFRLTPGEADYRFAR